MSTIDMWVPVLNIDIKDLPEGYELPCFKVKSLQNAHIVIIS